MVLKKVGRLLWTGRERSPLDIQWYLSGKIVHCFELSVYKSIESIWVITLNSKNNKVK